MDTIPKTLTEDSLAFPSLSDAEIDRLRPRGAEAFFKDGDALWMAGDTDFCFFVVLEGGISIVAGRDNTEVVRHGPRNFTGDIDVMTGRPAALCGLAAGDTRVLQISAEKLREIFRVEQDLGGKILSALMRRREILLDSDKIGMLLVGSSLDPETMALRTFLGRNRVLYRWSQPEDEAVAPILKGFELTVADTPIVFIGSEHFMHPSIDCLASKLGIRLKTDHSQYDLVIVGAGPAGLAAAVYGASEGLHTLLLDRAGPGGQASWSSRIENYMGFPAGLTGSQLAARGLIQAQKFGARISVPADVKNIECGERGQVIHLATGETIDARAVLVATGANYQKLDAPGFERYETSGVYYAATRLEAQFCEEAEIIVVGAGNSAGQAAVFLSQKAKKVRLVVRGDRLSKTMSEYLSYRVERIPNIEICLETEVAELEGDDKLRSVTLKGAHHDTVECEGLFVFVGATPNTDFLRETVLLDKKGFVCTGEAVREDWKLARAPYYLETSCPGIFAAGDCRVGSVKRVASGVGEGSMAVTFIHGFLA